MRQNWTRPLPVIALLLTSFFTARTQPKEPKAYESQVSYQKGQQLATILDLPYTDDVVESSIKDYMARRGLKGSGSRGFIVFRNVKMEDTATNLNDLYIKVARKSNQDRGMSVVTAMVTKPGEDPGLRMGRDELAQRRTAVYLEKMIPAIHAGDLEARIKDQESVTKKSQNKLGNLHDDQAGLEKKIKNTESDLNANKQDQVTETNAMQQNVHDDAALKKSHKKMDKLLSDATSMQKKLVKYKASLEENKRDQVGQDADASRQQHSLDSLKSLRKN